MLALTEILKSHKMFLDHSLERWLPGIAASLPLEEVHAAFTAKGHVWRTSSVRTDLSTYNTLQLAVQPLCNQQMKRATLIPREKLSYAQLHKSIRLESQ